MNQATCPCWNAADLNQAYASYTDDFFGTTGRETQMNNATHSAKVVDTNPTTIGCELRENVMVTTFDDDITAQEAEVCRALIRTRAAALGLACSGDACGGVIIR